MGRKEHQFKINLSFDEALRRSVKPIKESKEVVNLNKKEDSTVKRVGIMNAGLKSSSATKKTK